MVFLADPVEIGEGKLCVIKRLFWKGNYYDYSCCLKTNLVNIGSSKLWSIVFASQDEKPCATIRFLFLSIEIPFFRYTQGLLMGTKIGGGVNSF